MAARVRTDGRVALAAAALAILALCAAPLLWSIAQAVLAPWSAIPWQLWWSSISLAALGATLALVIGLLGHAALGIRAPFAARAITLAVISCCALPSYVHALTWSWSAPASWLAHERALAALVLGCSYAPVAFLVLLMTLRPVPRGLIEAGWMAGLPPARVRLLLARRVVAPLLAAWLSAFLLCFSDFPVADHFRIASYSTEVFARVAAWLNPAEAGRLALPILLTAVALIGLQQRLFGRTGTSGVSIRHDGPAERAPITMLARVAALLVFLGLLTVVPLVALVRAVASVDSVRAAFRSLAPELPATLALGVIVGIVATAVAMILSRARIGRAASWAALAWPASLVCLGALSISALPGVRALSLEWLPLGAVLVLRWLVLAYELWWNFWMRTSRSLEESCWMVGMPWWRALPRLFWRQGSITFAASVLLVTCFTINDLTVLVLLAPPGFSTTTLSIFSAVHYGPNSYLAALCIAQVLLLAALTVPAMYLLRHSHAAR
jgi:ABC-type Fe3+ transport system permease subunit